MKNIKMSNGRWPLPIIGDRISELELQVYLWTITFRAQDGRGSTLEIDEKAEIARGSQRRVIEMNGDPLQLAPLVELLECEITDAYATKNGVLSIACSNALTLTVGATTDYAWHFHKSRGDSDCCLKGGSGRLF